MHLRLDEHHDGAFHAGPVHGAPEGHYHINKAAWGELILTADLACPVSRTNLVLLFVFECLLKHMRGVVCSILNILPQCETLMQPKIFFS